MKNDNILDQIDQQITRLKQARALLTDRANEESSKRGRGRPRGSANKTTVAADFRVKSPKRVMTAEGKAKIAAAQKARWASSKKAKEPVKPAPKRSAKPDPSPTGQLSTEQ